MFDPKFTRNDPLILFGTNHLWCDGFGGQGSVILNTHPVSLTLRSVALRLTLQNKSIGPMAAMCLYNDFKSQLFKPASAPGIDPTFITYVGM